MERPDHPLPQRLFHWSNLISFLVLAYTGYVIHNPATGDGIGTLRYLHLVFAYAITLTLFLRLYYAIFGRYADASDFTFNRSDAGNLWPMVKYYLFLGPYPKTGKVNPLQKLAYAATFLTITLQALTGFALHWYNGIGAPVVDFFGGLASLRGIHTFLMWVFFVGVGLHIYMVLVESNEKLGSMLFGARGRASTKT